MQADMDSPIYTTKALRRQTFWMNVQIAAIIIAVVAAYTCALLGF